MTPEDFAQSNMNEGGPEYELEAVINRVTERADLLEGKKRGRLLGIEERTKGLPQNVGDSLREEGRSSLDRAKRSLNVLSSAAILAVAMSATPDAQAQQHPIEDRLSQNTVAMASAEDSISFEATKTITVQNTKIVAEALVEMIKEKARKTGEDLTVVVSPDATPGQRIDASLNALTKPPIVGAYAEKHIPGLYVINDLNKIRNDIALKEKLDRDDPELKKTSIAKLEQRIDTLTNETSTKQEVFDATLNIATDTPVISSIILKKVPLIALFYQANQLLKDLQDPKITKEVAAKKLGRAILDAKTFGIGSVIIDLLSPEPTKIAEASQEDNRQVITQ